MKKILLLLITFLGILSVKGQVNENKIILNIGFQNSDLSNKIFIAHNTDGLVTTSQSSKTFIDINLLYEIRQTKSKCIPAFGVGFNQKGFVDKGFYYPSDPLASFFTLTNKHSFISLLAGMNYQLFKINRTNVLAGQYLMPEYNVNHTDIYKTIAFSTKSTLTLEWNLTPKFTLYLSPYYTFSLTNYNSKKLSQRSADYRPVSFGMNIGLSLQ
jgi:hypothetical protein